MARRWKKEELAYLKRYARRRLISELAERFRTDSETIRTKLSELGVAARDSGGAAGLAHDPSIKLFEKAVRACHNEKWREAAKMLEEVLAKTDLVELGQSARRYLDVCEEHLDNNRSGSEDPYLEAVYERNLGNLDAALDLCLHGDRAGTDERFTYLAAAIYSLKSEPVKARGLLGKAIEMNPRNRVAALHDPDFDSLRADPEHAALFSAN